jgi:predicted nucleic acid-binding protein
MRFWDSSAIAPLLVTEEDSAARETQLRSDPGMVVWFGTPAELESALARRKRDGHLDALEERKARERLKLLAASWIEVEPLRSVRNRGIRLLRVHPLRAADAFQLAAALILCREQPQDFSFLTADQRLRSAADAEGFRAD